MNLLTPDDVLAASEQMLRRGEAHVVVNVVWTRAPTSGKAGLKAIVTADGKLTGWIGGACSQGAVIRHAQDALSDGQPRVLCVGSQDEFPAPDEGRFIERATCSSKGALELFLEPRLPRPQLTLFGDQPIAEVLGTMGRALGYEIIAFGQEERERPEAHRYFVDLERLTNVSIHEQSYIVVCTMGMFDKAALQAALATAAPFISLVASRRRASSILGGLRKAGYSEEQLSRIRAPAGLDLGSITHEEISVAILAEIVKFRAARRVASVEANNAATESVA